MQINIIGSGWLALPLAAHLQAAGHQLLLTSRNKDKITGIQATGARALIYDLGDQLTDPEQLFQADVLIIAITSKEVAGFDILMDQLNEQPCNHLIYTSSTSVYANDTQTHDELSQALNDSNDLLQIEQLIRTHSSNTIIRMAGLVGPNRHPGKFFSQGRTLKNPSAPVNLIHLEDCINIIQTIIQQNAWNEIFNACADTHPSKFNFYSYMASQLGLKPPNTEENALSSHKTISNLKVKNALDYQFIHPDVMKMSF